MLNLHVPPIACGGDVLLLEKWIVLLKKKGDELLKCLSAPNSISQLSHGNILIGIKEIKHIDALSFKHR